MSSTTRGRYDGGRDATVPTDGLARAPPSLNVRTAVGAVQDPQRRDRRVQVTIAQDTLENELSRGRIAEPAYAMGRKLQAVWEKGAGARLGSPNLDGVRGGSIREAQILRLAHGIVDARKIDATNKQAVRLIGTIGMRYLAAFLIGGLTYSSYLEGIGRPVTVVTIKDTAQRFRDLLTDLAADWRE